MFFWMREILGWLLVAIGLAVLWGGVDLLSDPAIPRVFEAGVWVFGALGLTRLGILLIRISTAARICQKEAPRTS